MRQHWEKDGPTSAPDGAEEPTRRSLLTPRSGARKRARLLPTAARRGPLSFALRALRAVPFAAFRYVLHSEEYLQLLSHNVEGGSINNAEIADEAGGMDGCQLMQTQCG